MNRSEPPLPRLVKGVSSMKLHRDLGISQKTAWMLVHKIREGFLSDSLEANMDTPSGVPAAP